MAAYEKFSYIINIETSNINIFLSRSHFVVLKRPKAICAHTLNLFLFTWSRNKADLIRILCLFNVRNIELLEIKWQENLEIPTPKHIENYNIIFMIFVHLMQPFLLYIEIFHLNFNWTAIIFTFHYCILICFIRVNCHNLLLNNVN